MLNFNRKEDLLESTEVIWVQVGAEEEFKDQIEIDKQCYR
jgi:hypothetical protein